MIDYEIIQKTAKAEYCVIWLHGLGADGHDFVDIVPHLKLSNPNVRFIFPHANIMPVTINMGMAMRAWYDIKSLDANSLNRVVDVAGIENSIIEINALIDMQIEDGIKPENIILAGFSQGGVIATYTLITSERRFAGLMALSTYLPAWNDFKQHITDINKGVDTIVCHGSDDQVLPVLLGKQLSKELKGNGFSNEYKEYQFMQHSVCPDEIDDISIFLNRVMAK